MGAVTEQFEKIELGKEVMEEIVRPYFERIFFFSLKRTNNRIDAEDLA